jgi:monomeric sarcosine oxidase
MSGTFILHDTIASMNSQTGFDVAVIGAGVFGAWTAYQLRQSGAATLLVDAYGPANSRSSSGGESRIIRMGYGPDVLYSRSAIRSLVLWKELFKRVGDHSLFKETGVLWLAKEEDPYCEATLKTLGRLGVNVEKFSGDEIQRRYPQFNFSDIKWGLIESTSGALMARRAVQTIVSQTIKDGTTFLGARVVPPTNKDRLDFLETTGGSTIRAENFVFACGPWLGKLFPEILEGAIRVTRQEVYFFGTPAGDNRFAPEHTPIWIDFNDLVYTFPNLESRGFKLAIDAHGPEFDPDSGDRVVTQTGLTSARAALQKRVPDLADAPVTETRVCQYENTSNGDFLIDRHPQFENVWLVGGGSGHGFKHGPAVAEYVQSMLSGSEMPERRFALEAKSRTHQREVF